MNNFKKVGLTALAGSLVAVSAYAGEVTVAGSASMKVRHVDGGAANAGKAFSMGNQLTFSGSGELDNGLNVSVSFVLDQNDDTYTTTAGTGTNAHNGAPFDSHSVTVSSDGLGSLTFHGEVVLLLNQQLILLQLEIFGILVLVLQQLLIQKHLKRQSTC